MRLRWFHDLEWCPDCRVLICHSCEGECTLGKESDDVAA